MNKSTNKFEINPENLSTGWVKLYRSIPNKGWYKKSEYLHLWVEKPVLEIR
jgi:hypothetical protein